VAVCNHFTLLVLGYVNYRLETLLKVTNVSIQISDIFGLTVGFKFIILSLFIPAMLKVHLSVIFMYINSQTQLYIQVLATSNFRYLLLLFNFSFLTTCFDPFIRAIFRSTIVQSPLLSVMPITARFAV
jgi:hypothetical protein